MEIVLTAEESSALNKALESYTSDLRMEITDTDNPEYRRGLRAERAALESVLTKLHDGRASSPERDDAGRIVVRWVSVYSTDR